MKISGFTIARNAVKYNYPMLESIRSILPICDEFIVNVGDSEDDTLKLVQSLKDPKIRIIQNRWDMSQRSIVLSYQTNLALKECKGDWAFYLQSDEVIHENDLASLKKMMADNLNDKSVEAFRFQWLHFYGTYNRYRIDSGWFQKQDRIIRNNGEIESMGDAFGFQRKDGKEIKRKNAQTLLYHYGWVQTPQLMTQRRVNAENIGFISLVDKEREKDYSFGELGRFPVYFGSHPAVMQERIKSHQMTQEDLCQIEKEYWWHPWKIFRCRLKTGRRMKEKIQ